MFAPSHVRPKSWTSTVSRADRDTPPSIHSAHTPRNSPKLKRWASGMQRRSWSKTGLELLDGPRQQLQPEWGSGMTAVACATRPLSELTAIDEAKWMLGTALTGTELGTMVDGGTRSQRRRNDRASQVSHQMGLATDLVAPGQGPMRWCAPSRRRSSPGKSRLRQTFRLRDAARQMDARDVLRQRDASSCSSIPGPALSRPPCAPESAGSISLADSCGGDDGDDRDDYICALSDSSYDTFEFWLGDSDCDDDGSSFSRGFDSEEEDDHHDDDGVVVRSGPRHTLRNTHPHGTWTAAERMRITNVSTHWQIPREAAAELVANVDSAQSVMC